MTTSNPNEHYHQLNSETGRINWSELLPHFARGVVIWLAPGEDLIAAASYFAADNRQQVEQMMAQQRLRPSNDDDARRWSQTEPEFWAVVVAPWVLVQEITAD